MAQRISDKPWSFSEADYSDEAFCLAALIDLNPKGARKTKAQCKLPVREPNGALNRNGVHAAAQRIAQVDAPASTVRKAAAMLIRLYRHLDEEPPDSLRSLAR